MNTAKRNESSASTPILVLGSTGKTGRRIAQRLTERGHLVRHGSRRSDPPFDWNDNATWNAVLEGIESVYISYAPDLAIPGAADTIRAFVDVAVERGVERLVLLSGRGEQEAQRCERIIQREEVDWTVVRASWFFQNFSEGAFADMVVAGEIALPAGGVREPFVDADDIADVAVAALTEPGHAGEIYELTGPRMLTFAEAVHEIARAIERPVRYVQIPHEAFVAGVAEAGVPKDVAWMLDYLFSTVLDGRNSNVVDGVRRALGRDARDFADYARDVATAGGWNQ
jgi:uncharacterized protein YbjT (DUF2867 family)